MDTGGTNMSRFSRFTKKALAIVLCAAVVATVTIPASDLTGHRRSTREQHI